MPAPDAAALRRFWDDALARSRAAPLEARTEDARSPNAYLRSLVEYSGFDGVRVRAWLAVPPEGRPAAGWPAIVTTTGYSGRPMGIDLNEAQRGYAVLQVYPRAQGESAEVWKGPPLGGDWIGHGAGAVEGYYYQGAYLDVLRGIDYLLSRDDVDRGRIGLMGTSQAGAIVLAVAALDQRVRAVTAHVPFLCDMRRNANFAKRVGGNAAFLDLFDHFDPLRLAPWITAPTLVSAGGRDVTSPPEGIRAMAERLACVKALFEDPELTHTTSRAFYDLEWAWMERYLR